MSTFKSAHSGDYNLADALQSAITGSPLRGMAGEISKELSNRNGNDGQIRIPLSALIVAKTGAGPLTSGAVPLNGFTMDNTIVDTGSAIGRELLIGKMGATMVTTSEAQYRMPVATSRPVATIQDLDESVGNDESALTSRTIDPVTVGATTTVENSLNLIQSPDAVRYVSDSIVRAISEAIDAAALGGYGPTTSGRTFAGLTGAATNTALTITSASGITAWNAVKESYLGYLNISEDAAAKWLLHPQITGGVLPSSPMFAGSLAAIAPGSGVDFLLNNTVVAGRTAPVAGNFEGYYGDFSQLVAVMFNSATIALTSNPYLAGEFERGAVKMRAITTFGMGIRDPQRIRKFVAGL